jgi:hypothetical protein
MKQTSGWSRSNGTPHDEPNIEDILASGIVLLPRTRTVSLLELRTVARHFWKASDMIKANPRLIRRVYEVLDDNGKIKFLAQLQSLFTSLGKLATSSAPRICWEGAPCLTDNLRRHSIALSIETVLESGWESIGIYRVSRASGGCAKAPSLPCCEDIWTEIANSEAPWTVFWEFEESDLSRVLGVWNPPAPRPPNISPKPRYRDRCYFISYEERKFYVVQDGKCERIDDVWNFVIE